MIYLAYTPVTARVAETPSVTRGRDQGMPDNPWIIIRVDAGFLNYGNEGL